MVARQQHLERAALPHQSRQPLAAGIAGNDAEVDLGLAEARGVGGNAQRARHRQLAAAAQREAVDGRDHRLAEVVDGVEDPLPVTRVLLAFRGREHGQLVDVGAGHERLLAGAGEDNRADVVVGAKPAIAAASSARVWPLSAFTLGRLMVRMATAPSRASSRLSKVMRAPRGGPLRPAMNA